MRSLRIERSGFEPGTLAMDIVLCNCSRHFALTVPLPTQVYKWVPANLIPAMALHPIQRGVKILLVTSCFGNRDKLRLMGHTHTDLI